MRSRSIRRSTDGQSPRGARARKNETRRAVRTTRWARGRAAFFQTAARGSARDPGRGGGAGGGGCAVRARTVPRSRSRRAPPFAGPAARLHGVRPWPLAVLSAVCHFAVPTPERRSVRSRAGPSNGVQRAPRPKKPAENAREGRVRPSTTHSSVRAAPAPLIDAPVRASRRHQRTLVCRDVEHEVNEKTRADFGSEQRPVGRLC